MAQVRKSTKYLKLVGGLNPGTARVSTDNSKDEVILDRCAISSPATALFSIIFQLTPFANHSLHGHVAF